MGCRDGALQKYLPGEIRYSGVDLNPGPFVSKACDVEEGLPFPDDSFGAVVALDLLEHTENPWFVFSEMVRVARRQIMIVLPNSYHWKARLRFLRGREGDKYRLPHEPVRDRHRWVLSFHTARAFAAQMAEKYRLAVAESIMVDERRNLLREFAAHFFSQNLMSTAVFYAFRKERSGR